MRCRSRSPSPASESGRPRHGSRGSGRAGSSSSGRMRRTSPWPAPASASSSIELERRSARAAPRLSRAGRRALRTRRSSRSRSADTGRPSAIAGRSRPDDSIGSAPPCFFRFFTSFTIDGTASRGCQQNAAEKKRCAAERNQPRLEHVALRQARRCCRRSVTSKSRPVNSSRSRTAPVASFFTSNKPCTVSVNARNATARSGGPSVRTLRVQLRRRRLPACGADDRTGSTRGTTPSAARSCLSSSKISPVRLEELLRAPRADLACAARGSRTPPARRGTAETSPTSGATAPSAARSARTGTARRAGRATASGWYCTLKAGASRHREPFDGVVVQVQVRDDAPCPSGSASSTAKPWFCAVISTLPGRRGPSPAGCAPRWPNFIL